MGLRWLSNICDPKLPDSFIRITTRDGESQCKAWKLQEEWLVGKVIDRPRATKWCSIEQLEAMGLVGVYVHDETYDPTAESRKNAPAAIQGERL